jgi:hypothetical protein
MFEMTETALTRRTAPKRKVLLGLAALIIVLVGGVGVWTMTCPCNRTPGFMLLGDLQTTPVTDWSFVNDIPLCQIQIYAGFIPHAVNLNCMATPEGDLFLSCSVCSSKYWASQVGPNEPGRVRLNGRVYPVVLNRVQDEAVLDRAWAARVKKLQVHGEPPYNPAPPPDAKRPESWWSFQLRSAAD